MTTYPNVPNVAGVPPVGRNGTNNPTSPAPVSSDGPISGNTTPGPQWGIFDANMNPVIIGDSVVSVELMKESKISTYPVEQGSFSSYNKVALPFQSRVSIAKAGTTSERQTFMNTVDAAYQGLTLYSVVTPEETYQSANIVHYSFDRSAQNGASIIIADIWLEEVRATAATTLSTTVNPLSAAQTDTGAVQPQTPSAAQTQTVESQGAN